MPEKWTGQLIGKMHNERVAVNELAAELGVSRSYVSMILNGKRKPEGAQKRMKAALDEILRRRENGND